MFDNAIEFGLSDKGQFQRSRLQREIVVHRVMSDLGRLVVINDGQQRGHKHQTTLHVFLNLLQIWLGALDQELPGNSRSRRS